MVGIALQGAAARIRVLALPDLAYKGDVSDWIENGGTVDELRRLAQAAPDWDAAQGRAPLEPLWRDRADAAPLGGQSHSARGGDLHRFRAMGDVQDDRRA